MLSGELSGSVKISGSSSNPVKITGSTSLVTRKAAVSDIIDRLDSNDNDKALAARQGSVLKGMIDETNAKLDEAIDQKTEEIEDNTELIRETKAELQQEMAENKSGLEDRIDEVVQNAEETYATKTELGDTKEEVEEYALNKANAALTEATSNTTNVLKGYSTTVEIAAAIRETSDQNDVTADNKIADHNTSVTAHQDIRGIIRDAKEELDLNLATTKSELEEKIQNGSVSTDTAISAIKSELEQELSDAKVLLEQDAQNKLSESKLYTDEAKTELSTLISSIQGALEADDNTLGDLIDKLQTRLNALADSDDTTLDQLSEIVAYIKSNRDLIDAVTTSKVSVSDIVDGLGSTAANKPLSANQGFQLGYSIDRLRENKVDKVSGKGLSTNDYTDDDKGNLANVLKTVGQRLGTSEIIEFNSVSDFPERGSGFGRVGGRSQLELYSGFVIPAWSEVLFISTYGTTDGALLAVDVSGYIYSAFRNSGNWTNGRIHKPNVQSDWSVTDTNSDAYIKNKPTITTYSAATTSAAGLMSASDKSKLDGIANNAVMTGATASSKGASGLVPAPMSGYNNRLLRGDGSWAVTIDIGRQSGSTIGGYSTAEGIYATASGYCSHAEGHTTTASGYYSHAEGEITTASGSASHAEGSNTYADGNRSHSEGKGTHADGDYSHTEGSGTTATGDASHAEGSDTTASGNMSHAGGFGTTASSLAQTSIGKYNVIYGTSSGAVNALFIVGNGSAGASSNAFRVHSDGHVYSKYATISTGADYAEYFEWFDGNPDNEDRRGYFVALEGRKIRKATPNDQYILGIVSAVPVVIGNGDPDNWHGRFLKDEFGNFIMEKVTEKYPTGELDEDGNEVFKEQEVDSYILNPDFDESMDTDYVPRSDRKEWSAIGMVGVLTVRDDGTCEINSYCKSNDEGIATAAGNVELEVVDGMIKKNYRVVERVNENLVRVLVR